MHQVAEMCQQQQRQQGGGLIFAGFPIRGNPLFFVIHLELSITFQKQLNIATLTFKLKDVKS